MEIVVTISTLSILLLSYFLWDTLKTLKEKSDLLVHYKAMYYTYVYYHRNKETEQVYFLKREMASLLVQYQKEIRRLSNPNKIYAINPYSITVPIVTLSRPDTSDYFIDPINQRTESRIFDTVNYKTENIKFENKQLNLTLRQSLLDDKRVRERVYLKLVDYLIESQAVEFKENHIERRIEVSLKVVS